MDNVGVKLDFFSGLTSEANAAYTELVAARKASDVARSASGRGMCGEAAHIREDVAWAAWVKARDAAY